MHLFSATSPPVDPWPFAVLAISVALIVFLITVLRVHAFLALILAAVTAGILAGGFAEELLPAALKGRGHWLQAIELTTYEFGTVAGKIAVVIGLASVISMCLMESGAADKVVRRFLRLFGEKRAGTAILTSGYVVSIPIFFDTFFMLLLPLARAMSLRTGKNYLLYVLAICCCGTVTHSLCPPHPGPLAMAETLNVDLGLAILVGIAAGMLPTASSWCVAKWLNRRYEIPLRETPGTDLADLKQIVDKSEEELPSFFWSIAPIVVPILLMSLASFSDAAVKRPREFSGLVAVLGGETAFQAIARWLEFVGNRNIALLVGAVIAMAVLVRQKGLTVGRVCERLGPPLETAGVIILITSAGGAFGLMLKNAGVGESIKAAVAGHEINLIVLAWIVSAVIRVAQGSATVAMLTTAAMVYPIMTSGPPLPYHPIYIFMSIGFGAMTLSWMNDSGFWVVGRLSGFTERETLRSWTLIVTVNSLVGLMECLVLSRLLPFAPRLAASIQ